MTVLVQSHTQITIRCLGASIGKKGVKDVRLLRPSKSIRRVTNTSRTLVLLFVCLEVEDEVITTQT